MTDYILWDIDGVFNPYMATDLIERGFSRYNQDWISWDLDVVNHGQWMRELESAANFVWASNWGDESNALVKWFFLESLHYPHIPLNMATEHSGTWKLPSISDWVRNDVAPAEKVVWVDDELDEDAFVWAQQRGNTLLLKTDPAVGLTREHVDTILAFLGR